MAAGLYRLIDELAERRSLSLDSYEALIVGHTPELAAYAAQRADAARRALFGTKVYARGLIEVSSFCKNDCLYCGIRRSNASAERYRLTSEQILACTREGYELGFRTFVLQGGEDAYFTDERLCAIVGAIKREHPDCAVTLSLGERSRESYQALFDAGADRYLLRHETADPLHYACLHPSDMSFERRMRCLADLHEIGFATGCGFMVGSPFQTSADLAADLAFIERFGPEMCGIGPFVPHHATPFANEAAGSAELTCYLLSLLRIMRPGMLIPATTALGTALADGRERGVLAGANVVMPNLSPPDVRSKYELYDNKVYSGTEAAESWALLDARMRRIGFELAVDRGDPKTGSTYMRRES